MRICKIYKAKGKYKIYKVKIPLWWRTCLYKPYIKYLFVLYTKEFQLDIICNKLKNFCLLK